MEFDALFALLPLLGMSVALVFGIYLLAELNAGDQLCQGNVQCQAVNGQIDQTLFLADKVIILLYVCQIVGAVYSALQVQSHPLMWVFTVITCVLIWLIVPYLVNMFFSLVNDSMLNATAIQLTGSIAFWNSALFLSTVSAVVIGVATHGKKQGQGSFAWAE